MAWVAISGDGHRVAFSRVVQRKKLWEAFGVVVHDRRTVEYLRGNVEVDRLDLSSRTPSLSADGRFLGSASEESEPSQWGSGVFVRDLEWGLRSLAL